jgi:RNA polymerase sigma-70 factor, ECF subfamily
VHQNGFEQLYADTWRDLLGYALRRTADPQDAADVVAEVFTVAWRRCADIPAGPAGRLWPFGVARHVLANHRRGELRRGNLGGALRAALATGVATVADPARDVQERAEAAEVTRALRALPDADRELLTLIAWDGLSPAEAGTVLGLNAATVRVRLHRARQRLRKLLGAATSAAPTFGHSVERSRSNGHVLADGRSLVPVEETP